MQGKIHLVWSVLFIGFLVTGSLEQTFSQEKTEAGTRQYNAAVQLQNRAAYDLAAAEWVKFINTYKTDPRCDRAFHYLGVCYLKANQLDLARQCFETVAKSYPKCELLDASYYCLGSTLYNQAQSGKAELYDAAAAAFDTVATKFPNSKYVPQSLFNRGECFYRSNKKQEAAAMYAQLLTKNTGDKLAVEALYALGVTQEELGQHAEAGKSYDQFLEKYPQSPLLDEVTVRRGETLFSQGQFEPAAQRFAAAAAKPGFALADHATIRQAASLVQLKKYPEAAALYASISTKWPQSKLLGAANLAAGKCHFLAGNFADAHKTLEPVLAAGGESAGEAAHWLVRSAIKEGKPAEAAASAEKMLAKLGDSPQTAQLMMDRADAVYEIPERRGESSALYAAMAAKYPQDVLAPQALYMAGFAAMGQNDYPTAIRYAVAFLAAYPNSDLAADVTYVAAESNLQTSQFAVADKGFETLLQKYPSHADAETWKVRRGLALYLQKKFADTIAMLQPMLAGLRSPDALAEAQYLVGASQAEMKQFDAAAKSLETSLAAQPKWRQADDTLLLLAQAYTELKNNDKAKAALARLVADFSNSKALDRAHYRLAELAFASGDFNTAAAEYQQVVEKWPQSSLAPHSFYGLGWAKLSQNDFAAAEKSFDAMVQKQPNHKLIPRARYARGVARHQLKNYAGAIEDIQALLAADPTPTEKADAQYLLGLCQSGLQKHADATASLQAILTENPKYAGADKVLYELAWSLKQQGKEKEAVEAFARLAAEHAESPLASEAQYHAGEAAYKAGDFKKAAVAYHAAMTKAGKTELGEKAAHKLGWAFFRTDDFANAQQTFRYQQATWPTGPLASDAAFMEGDALLKQKKYAEALAIYGQVKTPSSKDFEVLALLHAGQAAAQLRQWDKSLELLGSCVKKFANSEYMPETLYERGWARQNLGKMDEALADYQQVVAKTDREVAARAQFMIGEVQFQQKNHKEAVASFFKVSYGYSYPQWQAEAAYEAGRCFEVLGKKEQALKQYQELIDKFPQSDKTPLAKQRIEELKK